MALSGTDRSHHLLNTASLRVSGRYTPANFADYPDEAKETLLWCSERLPELREGNVTRV